MGGWRSSGNIVIRWTGFCYELPAGCCRDTGGAALETVARNELREEIGGTAGALEYVTWFYSSSSISDEVCHVFSSPRT